ncbi:hypothetical protein DOE76_01060 [Leifsonia sp. ku-ls]|nr:hypothetical protein DOE76_01060 [Leifsonia sp. ku-ls]
MTDAPSPLDTLERFGAANLRVRQLLADSREAQWRAGKTPVPKEDTTERSKGLVSDPTANIVLDTRRVALREAALAAERALADADRAMRFAEARLADALAQGS